MAKALGAPIAARPPKGIKYVAALALITLGTYLQGWRGGRETVQACETETDGGCTAAYFRLLLSQTLKCEVVYQPA